ncbi:MAG TPA: PASTA domain-containing protein [Candidatus Anoxymicrobiaceae bacterium]
MGGLSAVILAGIVVLSLFLAGVFSTAVGETKVPNLINLPRQQAGPVLKEAGLESGKVTVGFSYDIWKDKVMKQMPSAGTVVNKESTVDYVVSLGNDVVKVPDVINQPEATATQILKNFGFAVVKATNSKTGVQVGFVIATHPAPGTLQSKGAKVAMVVNTAQASQSGAQATQPRKLPVRQRTLPIPGQ